MSSTRRDASDDTVAIEVNGTRQRVRICARHPDRPPLLIVQGGPGLPLLNEIPKYQRLLDLERDFHVAYWEQRGCGDAPAGDADRVTMHQQGEDLRTVLGWLFARTNQRVTVLGISIGGTFALQAAGQESDRVEAIVAVSVDSQTASADAAADAFIRARAGGHAKRGTRTRAARLPRPPYTDPAAFQQRVRLLSDLGAIEHGKTFAALLRETMISLFRTYGAAGAIRALRNMNRIQRGLMPAINGLDLFAAPPRVTVPVRLVFGERDALNPPSIVNRLPSAIAAPGTTVTVVPNAGHMVHFDQPSVVRSVLINA